METEAERRQHVEDDAAFDEQDRQLGILQRRWMIATVFFGGALVASLAHTLATTAVGGCP